MYRELNERFQQVQKKMHENLQMYKNLKEKVDAFIKNAKESITLRLADPSSYKFCVDLISKHFSEASVALNQALTEAVSQVTVSNDEESDFEFKR